ncbi:hypothetical protein PPACK8108_LOCUS7056 [Phakopsora pachyrhizi]|uniref:Uncharacterized protein n=1 Tax=Phakopsora pachyrhizi TaxID=170000 RepID=A0AAV0ASI4_PHAPC|nr:hypothetical protein PPACK8108_LOCUS7056 [Phakopsora pachyrhizi]
MAECGEDQIRKRGRSRREKGKIKEGMGKIKEGMGKWNKIVVERGGILEMGRGALKTDLSWWFLVVVKFAEDVHLQAVLVDEPTPVEGTAADDHSHTRSQTVSQPAVQGSGSAIPSLNHQRIFSTSAANLLTPSSQSTSTITTTRTSNAASGSCNATTINSITTTTTNNSNNNTTAMTPAATTTTPDTSAAAAAQQQLGHLTYPTGGRRQDAGWDNPTEPYLHKPDIQLEKMLIDEEGSFLEKVKTKTYKTNNQLRRHKSIVSTTTSSNHIIQQQQQQQKQDSSTSTTSSSAKSFLTPTHHHPNGNSFRNPWPSAIQSTSSSSSLSSIQLSRRIESDLNLSEKLRVNSKDFTPMIKSRMMIMTIGKKLTFGQKLEKSKFIRK